LPIDSVVTKPRPKAVVVCSGGLDSTVLLYYVLQQYDVHVLSFDYGQRHSKELDYIAALCAKLELPHEIADLTNIQGLLRSSLTFQGEVPEGHYAQENMSQTIVPNRNAIMLSVAYGWSLSLGADAVFIGAHAGDHPIYPDCRKEFFTSLSAAFQLGSQSHLKLEAPFVHLSKADIVHIGRVHSVPFSQTWSCYKGGEVHCGRCGTCVERAEAFSLAKVPDPTVYADSEYWKQVTHGA
jgi:7-cyano-7-deazaguanine synthase